MTKRPMKLKVRIPSYRYPRNDWRRAIYQAVSDRQADSPVQYHPDDKLEVTIKLYLKPGDLEIHDLDNRLKDCLDALQGRVGGSKAKRLLQPIVPNDRQIYRVIIEKSLSPKQGGDLGHLTIRRFRAE